VGVAKAHGAGAGDDEHGDRVDQAEGQGRVGARSEPARGRSEREPHHGGDEPHGDAVHERLDGSLPPCASSTMRTICASTVPSPTAVARKASAPVWLTVPPTTERPSPSGPALARR
jgi:hypothetical protein